MNAYALKSGWSARHRFTSLCLRIPPHPHGAAILTAQQSVRRRSKPSRAEDRTPRIRRKRSVNRTVLNPVVSEPLTAGPLRGSTRRVSADTTRHSTRHSSCVASTDTARLISERAAPHHSTPFIEKGEQMNKHELVSHVAAETPVTRADAERLVGVVLSAIADALARGEPVTIAGFGKFATRSRGARTGPNPRTGEPVAIAASRTPSFKPAKALRDAVNE